jgi:hypothetical protein
VRQEGRHHPIDPLSRRYRGLERRTLRGGGQAADRVRRRRELARRQDAIEAGPHRRRGAGRRDLGTPFTTAYTGIAFSKDDTTFRDLIADTLPGMIADGSYGKILDKWRPSQIAIPAITINGKPRS